MTFHLFDTATRTVTPFQPLTPGKVGIYVCGATVQSAPHIGHLRPSVAFDILRRWLTRSGLEVTLIRNITDIDDKILAKSEAAGVPWWAHAAGIERLFTAAYDALGVIPPTYEPRATQHVTQMVELMQRLIDAGHAYATSPGNVWFDVPSWPAYGELTGQRLEDLSSDDDAASEKHSPHDFALWKAPKDTEPVTASWPTPWGRGRPGWHLECSAMAQRYLGDTFDIHGGGLDLRFPHHENEQAQSRAAGFGFAQRWMHTAWITASGAKMSKSLGNGLLASDVLAAAPPAVVRYAIAAVQYRSMLEWSPGTLAEAGAAWDRITGFVTRASEQGAPGALGGPGASVEPGGPGAAVELGTSVEPGALGEAVTSVEQGATSARDETTSQTTPGLAAVTLPAAFVEAMDDDLNTPGALAVIHETVRAGNTKLAARQNASEELLAVRAMLDVFGLDPLDPHWAHSGGADSASDQALQALVAAELDARAEARAAKDWATADAVRNRLTAAGITIEDTPAGARWELT
ncbi:MAG: cysteine--tRNA ligase [Cellulomonadaceae bacterium]|nr:cysteine--tRNA ligase [Cellulomonadaceae bacterium]